MYEFACGVCLTCFVVYLPIRSLEERNANLETAANTCSAALANVYGQQIPYTLQANQVQQETKEY